MFIKHENSDSLLHFRAFNFYNNRMEKSIQEYLSSISEENLYDPMTGVYNKDVFLSVCSLLIKQEIPFALYIIDFDNFKKVNDTYGHDAGDKVLKAISKVFREEMGDKYMAARWGGEEFLLLFPDTNGDAAFIKLCEIRRKIKDVVVTKGEEEIRVTMTFGLAEYDYSGSYEGMLTNADQKLYRGKEDGRDRIVY